MINRDHYLKIHTFGVVNTALLILVRGTFHWPIIKSNQANLTVLASLRDLLGVRPLIGYHQYLLHSEILFINRGLSLSKLMHYISKPWQSNMQWAGWWWWCATTYSIWVPETFQDNYGFCPVRIKQNNHNFFSNVDIFELSFA